MDRSIDLEELIERWTVLDDERVLRVEDAEKLTGWLATEVCERERPNRVRQELLGRCRMERIEPPSDNRVDRLVRAGLHRAEVTLTSRVAGRLSPSPAARLEAVISVADDDAACRRSLRARRRPGM